LPADDRRALLKSLSDEQYEDITKVLGNMPYIDFQVRCEGTFFKFSIIMCFKITQILVIDDEEPTVYTAGAIVTVTVILERKNMAVLFGDSSAPDKTADESKVEEEEPEKKDEAKKPLAWQKQKKGKKGGKKSAKKPAPSTTKAPAPAGSSTPTATGVTKKSLEKAEEEKKEEKAEISADPDDSELSDDEAEHSDESEDEAQADKKGSVDDDDVEWEKFQNKIAKREKVLEGRSKMSHSVHCPFYPDVSKTIYFSSQLLV
jgi:translocation protein SEC63